MLFTDPLYTSFHNEEWGVLVHDDRKLFELLVLSEALAELSWPTILNKDLFRKLFVNFDGASVANFTEKKILSLKANGSILLSEQKLRAVVENARQMLKTPKSEVMSNDMMQRGFCCVGPTVYSFMQVAGIVNDHLLACFRYKECNNNIRKDFNAKIGDTEKLAKSLENAYLSHI
ncbi:hypothetical protein HHK36_010075 [Tetracentron sinense]|uniref:DNA-3-methyladenine glycosylase I n=1 Tax=Tetracentron sinense TaxID=13715 RepID=A0A834ZGW8_TETSI|nr:hypothetical protein HHK36_010075 [Tetracentron sinense]